MPSTTLWVTAGATEARHTARTSLGEWPAWTRNAADRAAPLVRRPVGIGGEPPVGLELVAAEQPHGDLGVADVEGQEHGRSYRVREASASSTVPRADAAVSRPARRTSSAPSASDPLRHAGRAAPRSSRPRSQSRRGEPRAARRREPVRVAIQRAERGHDRLDQDRRPAMSAGQHARQSDRGRRRAGRPAPGCVTLRPTPPRPSRALRPASAPRTGCRRPCARSSIRSLGHLSRTGAPRPARSRALRAPPGPREGSAARGPPSAGGRQHAEPESARRRCPARAPRPAPARLLVGHHRGAGRRAGLRQLVDDVHRRADPLEPDAGRPRAGHRSSSRSTRAERDPIPGEHARSCAARRSPERP